MDLQKLNLTYGANEGATLNVEHPITGEQLLDKQGNAVTIYLLGIESDKAREAIRVQAQRSMNKRIRPSIQEAQTASIGLLASLTTGWSGVEEAGVDVEFSVEAARDLYTRYDWLRQQVDTFVSERANFFKA